MPKNTNPITELLTTPGKGRHEVSNSPSGILAGLFRQILDEINMTPMRWSVLMNDYINDYRNGVPGTREKLSSMRGNLMKEFGKEKMTWKVFCKGLFFLKLPKVEFVLRAYWEDGHVTNHVYPVNLGKRSDLPELLKDLDTPDDQDEVDNTHKENPPFKEGSNDEHD